MTGFWSCEQNESKKEHEEWICVEMQDSSKNVEWMMITKSFYETSECKYLLKKNMYIESVIFEKEFQWYCLFKVILL